MTSADRELDLAGLQLRGLANVRHDAAQRRLRSRVLPLRDNVPARDFPFVTVGLHFGGFAFGLATVLLVAQRRPQAPPSRLPVY